MHKGQLYLSQLDVEAEISGVGAHVSFFVYADGTGLGAMNCRPADSPAVARTVTKPQAMNHQPPAAFRTTQANAGRPGAGAPQGQRKRVSNAMISGQVKAWKGGFGWITPLEPVSHPQFRGQIYVKGSDVAQGQALEVGTQVVFYLYADSQGLGAEQCSLMDENGVVLAEEPEAPAPAKGKAGGKGAGRVAPGPRERVTVVPTTGEVLEWKGNFGWIRPHEPVEHEKARQRGGKVYVAKRDLQGGGELEAGQLVQFHVFVDNSGVGAEECMPF